MITGSGGGYALSPAIMILNLTALTYNNNKS